MQRTLQSAKRLISVCLVTLLLVVSTVTISPAPAMADNGSSQSIPQLGGETWAFVAGVVTGVLVSGGSAATLTTAATTATAVASVAGSVATAAVAATAVAAAPVVAPVAIGSAVVGGAYALWQHFSPAPSP